MAPRSARSPKKRALEEFDDEGGFGAFIGKHRFAVGGLTAFAVAFSYVTANAIWYQPHAHASAFFATRPLGVQARLAVADGQADTQTGDVETVIRLEREQVQDTPTETARVELPATAPAATIPTPPPANAQQPAAGPITGDPVVADVQRILAGLNLYSGTVDGLTGPQTRAAIENYRKMVGLSASAEIDDQLLSQLGATARAATRTPPLPRGSPGTDMIETSSAAPREGDAKVMRIQAGLKAFGNDRIEVDGVVGERTKLAIIEFQSLFGLPETGAPDDAILAKMRDIGLTN